MGLDAGALLAGIEEEVCETVTAATAEAESAIKALFGTPAEEGGTHTGQVVRERSARVKYWRKPDGWITTGPDVRTDAAKFSQYIEVKRYRELPDSFGKEVINMGLMSWGGPAMRRREVQWLRPFITAGGMTYVIQHGDTFGTPGEYLMPAEQIVTLKLHRQPEIRAMRPDLNEATDLECPYACTTESDDGRSGGPGPRRLFSGLTRELAQRALDQHIVAVHKESVASRAVGDTIAQQMQHFQGAQIDPQAIAAIVAATVAALSGSQQGAIAAVAQEKKYTAKAKEEPAKQPGKPDGTWSRAQLMSYVSQKKWPRPPRAMALTTEEWLAYVLSKELEDGGANSDQQDWQEHGGPIGGFAA